MHEQSITLIKHMHACILLCNWYLFVKVIAVALFFFLQFNLLLNLFLHLGPLFISLCQLLKQVESEQRGRTL